MELVLSTGAVVPWSQATFNLPILALIFAAVLIVVVAAVWYCTKRTVLTHSASTFLLPSGYTVTLNGTNNR